MAEIEAAAAAVREHLATADEAALFYELDGDEVGFDGVINVRHLAGVALAAARKAGA